MIKLNPQVKEAYLNDGPVLVLESTLISHGLPYPTNVELMKEVFLICDSFEVVPAVIGIIDGRVTIGLDEDEIEILATVDDVLKVSTRDLGMVAARGKTGATTVSATIVVAAGAGLKVFATGGIGGVHRGVEKTFDISADLVELSRNSMIVISSGAKAILDLDKTVEYLETFGIRVLGYKTGKFPAFYSRESDLPIPKIDDVSGIVDIFKCNEEIGLKSSLLIANPVPEEFDIPPEIIDDYIREAIREAETSGIKGQKLTPFLLSKLVTLSQGRTLQSNIELIKNNVRLGCEIAREYYS